MTMKAAFCGVSKTSFTGSRIGSLDMSISQLSVGAAVSRLPQRMRWWVAQLVSHARCELNCAEMLGSAVRVRPSPPIPDRLLLPKAAVQPHVERRVERGLPLAWKRSVGL